MDNHKRSKSSLWSAEWRPSWHEVFLECSPLSLTHLQIHFIIRHQNKPTYVLILSVGNSQVVTASLTYFTVSVAYFISVETHKVFELLTHIVASQCYSIVFWQQNLFNCPTNIFSSYFTSGLKWPAIPQKSHLVKLRWVVPILSLRWEKDSDKC